MELPPQDGTLAWRLRRTGALDPEPCTPSFRGPRVGPAGPRLSRRTAFPDGAPCPILTPPLFCRLDENCPTHEIHLRNLPAPSRSPGRDPHRRHLRSTPPRRRGGFGRSRLPGSGHLLPEHLPHRRTERPWPGKSSGGCRAKSPRTVPSCAWRPRSAAARPTT